MISFEICYLPFGQLSVHTVWKIKTDEINYICNRSLWKLCYWKETWNFKHFKLILKKICIFHTYKRVLSGKDLSLVYNKGIGSFSTHKIKESIHFFFKRSCVFFSFIDYKMKILNILFYHLFLLSYL